MWKCSQCGENLEDNFDVCWSCGTSKEGIVNPKFLEADDGSPAPENEPLEQIPANIAEEPPHLVTVAQCQLAAEAHAMRLHLEAEGIPVFLADELTIAMDWLLSNAIGGVKVQVPEAFAERATQLLEGFSRPHEEKEEEE